MDACFAEKWLYRKCRSGNYVKQSKSKYLRCHTLRVLKYKQTTNFINIFDILNQI